MKDIIDILEEQLLLREQIAKATYLNAEEIGRKLLTAQKIDQLYRKEYRERLLEVTSGAEDWVAEVIKQELSDD